MSQGKLIVIYGINNIGKTTQVDTLVERMQAEGYPVKRLKYPVYDLEPTGPLINAICREGAGKDMSELEIQKVYAQNRRDYQPTVQALLDSGTHIVAEDYTGTGIAWGMTRDVSLEELEHINADLMKEDLVILMDGERFVGGKEAGHRNEENDVLMQKSRNIHQQLRDRYGWKTVNANQSIEEVHNDIWSIVHAIL